jgi:ribosomal protein L37AE/L43A
MNTTQLTLNTGGGPSAPANRPQKAAAVIYRKDVLCPVCLCPRAFRYVSATLQTCEACGYRLCERVWGPVLPVPEWRTA